MVNSSFPEIIRARRKAVGLGQDEVATAAGLAFSTYGRIERGEVVPRFDQILAIFKTLGIPLSSLTGEEEEPASVIDLLHRLEITVRQLRKLLGQK